MTKRRKGKGLPSELGRTKHGEGSKEERTFWCGPSHSLANQVMIYLFIDYLPSVCWQLCQCSAYIISNPRVASD